MRDRKRQRILLVNDDGIDAPGMKVLEKSALEISDDVWVVAPERNYSGASQSLSITSPMLVSRRDDRHFALSATPAECVMLAIYEIMKDHPPSLCLSGINRGPNLAQDLAYSGTVAAAREATQLGVPSIALSQDFAPGERNFLIGEDRKIPWETSTAWCVPVINRLLSEPFDSRIFLNVNFPGVSPEEVDGLRATFQGQRPPGCYVPTPIDSNAAGRSYQLLLAYRQGEPHPDSDLHAIAQRSISVTPLKLDMTCLDSQAKLIQMEQPFF